MNLFKSKVSSEIVNIIILRALSCDKQLFIMLINRRFIFNPRPKCTRMTRESTLNFIVFLFYICILVKRFYLIINKLHKYTG